MCNVGLLETISEASKVKLISAIPTFGRKQQVEINNIYLMFFIISPHSNGLKPIR